MPVGAAFARSRAGRPTVRAAPQPGTRQPPRHRRIRRLSAAVRAAAGARHAGRRRPEWRGVVHTSGTPSPGGRTWSTDRRRERGGRAGARRARSPGRATCASAPAGGPRRPVHRLVAAIATKAALNELARGDTGYILLMAGGGAGRLVRWPARWDDGDRHGRRPQRRSSSSGRPAAGRRLELAPPDPVPRRRATATVAPRRVAPRRARPAGRRARRGRRPGRGGRARDARLELMLAASGTGFWEWDVADRRADLVRGDLPPARPRTRPRRAGIPDLSRHDPSRRSRGLPERRSAAAVDGATPSSLDFRRRLARRHRSTGPTAPAGCSVDDDGRPIRMIGTGQDITERRRVEDSATGCSPRSGAPGEFREAFVDVISHELRTPITTILGLTQILARPGRVDDEASRDGAARGRPRRVRAAPSPGRGPARPEPRRARPPRGRRRAVRAAPPARADRRPRGGASCRSITVETELEPDLPIVAGEATYVEQIVRNLLGNAAKYTPPGTASSSSDARPTGDVEVRVTDDGPGHPGRVASTASSSSSIATRRAHAWSPGSGIGLFVCASLVEAMGGRIWAARPPGAARSSGSPADPRADATRPTSVGSRSRASTRAPAAGSR